MASQWLRSGWSLAVFVPILLLAVVGSVAYVQREIVVAHWHTRAYLHSDAASDRLSWLRLHRNFVLPIAVDALRSDDPQVCRRAGALIRLILADLGDPTEPDAAQLSLVTMARLRDSFASFNSVARREALDAAHHLLRVHLERWSPHVPTVLDSAGAVFQDALEDQDLVVKEAALRKLPSLWPAIAVDGSSGPLMRAWLYGAYKTAAYMLTSVEPAVRLAAGSACCVAPFSDFDANLAALLEDDEPAVRKGFLLALAQSAHARLQGGQKYLVLDWLADSDALAVAAAEKILRASGVPACRVELLKLSASQNPSVRAKAAAFATSASMRPDGAFDPAAFLVDLSKDESADVRLAVVEAAAAATSQSLLARLRSMAREDADPRVRARCVEVTKKS